MQAYSNGYSHTGILVALLKGFMARKDVIMVMWDTRTSVNTAFILRFLFLVAAICVALQSVISVQAQSRRMSPISYGDTVSGNLDNDNDFDAYVFDARTGDLVTISMDKTSGDLDPAIYLYNSVGKKFAYDDDGGSGVNALLSEFVIVADGKYIINALRIDESQSGEYELRLTLSNPAPSAVIQSNSLMYGGTVRDRLHDDNNYDEYTFGARVGDLVTISMEKTSGDLDPAIRLYGSAGEILAYNDDGGADTNALLSEFHIPADGRYIIRALRFAASQSGDYKLQLSGYNPAAAKADPAALTVGGNCTLADAITAANEDRAVGGCPTGNGADTIWLTGDITLSAELPPIDSEITLEGGGHSISGDDRFRIFFVSEDGDVIIKSATLTKGMAGEGTGAAHCDASLRSSVAWGGAICNQNGQLRIIDSVFTGNSAIYGGAISSNGALSITNTEFSRNSADNDGGAIDNQGSMRVTYSKFEFNTVDRSRGGGAIDTLDEEGVEVVGSSFFRNGPQNCTGLRCVTIPFGRSDPEAVKAPKGQLCGHRHIRSYLRV